MPDAGWEGGADPRCDLGLAAALPRRHADPDARGSLRRRAVGSTPISAASSRAAHGGAWVYSPPPGTTLGGFNLTWSGVGGGGGEATLSRSDQPDPTYVERNRPARSDPMSSRRADSTSRRWRVIAACSFADSRVDADALIFPSSRAVMTLNDFSAPIVNSASGDLLSAATLRGPASVTVAAKDSGGGVYRVVVTADGKDVGSAVVPNSSGRCVQVDPADRATRSSGRSRVRSRSGRRVSLDTATLPEGTRSIGSRARGRGGEPDHAGGAGGADGRPSRDAERRRRRGGQADGALHGHDVVRPRGDRRSRGR